MFIMARNEALKIDEEKTQLEASVIPKIKRVFRDMALDAEIFYKTSGFIPEDLALNYYPEFLKEVRDAMRKSIRRFGFSLRSEVEAKHGLFFDAETKKQFISLEYKQKIKVIDENLDPKLEEVNNSFLRASTLFIANESERAVNFITETNAKELTLAAQQEEILFANTQAKLQQEINKLQFREATAVSSDQVAITRQIESAKRQLAASNANAEAIVAKNIRANLLDRSVARSDLIASQNVGVTEAWARQTEAELLQEASLVSESGLTVTVIKTWQSILDSKTRATHVEADLQQVPVDQPFIVGGEQLMFPRAPGGSAKNTINCRCVSVQSVS
tara:strand:- start:128 stop:1123 length:996 start_codon:yes stop_codon:yes gene_type:complete